MVEIPQSTSPALAKVCLSIVKCWSKLMPIFELLRRELLALVTEDEVKCDVYELASVCCLNSIGYRVMYQV